MKKIIGLLLLCLAACNIYSTPEIERRSIEEQNKNMESLRYCKDSRTNLCFAGCPINNSAYNAILTNVPCTPEVEKLIK